MIASGNHTTIKVNPSVKNQKIFDSSLYTREPWALPRQLDKLEFDEEVISMSKKKNKKKSNWTPPKEYKNYFYASSDEEFKAKHPIGYGFLVMLGIVALLLPAIVFCVLVGTESGWVMLGFAGGFVFGIGLFNFVAIIIKQYLGHWVSIISFLVGSIMMLISWFLCR